MPVVPVSRDHKWVRIHGGKPLDVEAERRFRAREKTLKYKHFLDACNEAGIPATVRQARKWNQGRGLAWMSRPR